MPEGRKESKAKGDEANYAKEKGRSPPFSDRFSGSFTVYLRDLNSGNSRHLVLEGRDSPQYPGNGISIREFS